jgi:4-hydroxy 2-oxovalerate aldolase
VDAFEAVTPRDGRHAVRHRRNVEQARTIAAAPDAAGAAAIETAHGDGPSGSRTAHGAGAHTDREWIEAVVGAVTPTVPTTPLLPGIGTLHGLGQARAPRIRSVRVAAHRTGAGISAQHIAAAREPGRYVAGPLPVARPCGVLLRRTRREAAGR